MIQPSETQLRRGVKPIPEALSKCAQEYAEIQSYNAEKRWANWRHFYSHQQH